jgi:hypothetical protein
MMTPVAGDDTGLQAWLRRTELPIYAVLDAARESRVLSSLIASGVDHESLYEGHQGAALSDVAPYLVRVEPGSPLVPELTHGWGRAWGVFVTSRSTTRILRARFRRLLMVHVGESQKPAYLRFYDPRVLRVLLPIATPRQVSWFFGDGEVQAYVAEDGDPRTALAFTETSSGVVRVERVALDEGQGGAGANAG